jgi:hypothetical protein
MFKLIKMSVVFFALFSFNADAKKMVLSLSGGGTRGIMEAEYIAQLEEATRKPVRKLFDVIVGSSTGGLLAILLSLPSEYDRTKPKYSAREIVEIYKDISKDIFKRSRLNKIFNPKGIFKSKYHSEDFEEILKGYLGRTLMQNLLGWVGVTTVNKDTQRILLLNNYDVLMTSNSVSNIYAYVAALATTAAPSYFDPVQIFTSGDPESQNFYLDGGIVSNTPVQQALTFARKIYPGEEFGIVSLGTGSADSDLEHIPNSYEYIDDNGAKSIVRRGVAHPLEIPRMAKDIFRRIFSKGLVNLGVLTLEIMRRGPMLEALWAVMDQVGSENFFHVQFPLDEKYRLDVTEDKILNEMQNIAKEKASFSNEQFNFIISYLFGNSSAFLLK